MSKIRAPKERLQRPMPHVERLIEPVAETPSMMPPAFNLQGEVPAQIPDSRHSAALGNASDQSGMDQHAKQIMALAMPSKQVLARGAVRNPNLPTLPKGHGKALDPKMRAAYEKALGIGLSMVRIHTGTEVERAAKALGAEALTHGSDIYLSRPLTPGDPESERALAHELLHVRQFLAGKVPSAEDGAVSKPGDPLEAEAYGQENEIAKAALEERGEPTDSPILNRTSTPPSAPNPPADDAGDASADFADLDADLEGELKEATPQNDAPENEENPNEGGTEEAPKVAEAGDAAAAPDADGGGSAEGPSALELPASEGKTPAAKPAVAAPEAPSVEPVSVETYPSKVDGKHKEPVDLAAQAARIQQLAASKSEALRSSGAQKLDAYRQAAMEAKAHMQQKAASSKQAIQAGYAAQIQALQASAAAQIAAVLAAATAQKAALQAFVTGEIARYTAAKAATLQAAHAAVEAKKAATQEAADAAAERARTESATLAQTVLSEASGMASGGDADAAEAKRKALNDIAQDAATKIRENGDKVANSLANDGSSCNGKYDEAFNAFSQSLEEKASEYIQNTTELGTSVGTAIDERAATAQTAIQAALSQGTQALQSASTDACAKIDAQLQRDTAQIDAAQSQVSSGFQAQYVQAAARMDSFGSECSAKLLQASTSDAAGVQAAVESMEAQINAFHSEMEGGFGSWLSQSQGEINSAEQGSGAAMDQMQAAETQSAIAIGTGLGTEISNAGATATQALGQLVINTQQTISASTEEMIGGMNDARADLDAKLDTTFQDAKQKMDDKVKEGLQAGERLASDARGKMQESAAEIDSEYNSLKSEAEAKNGEVSQRIMRGFWSWVGGIVDSVVTWFKEKFFDWLKGFIIGVLKALVIVLIIALIIFLAPELAIVLLIAGVCMGIYSRWQEYKQDNNGKSPEGWWILGVGVLGILDITGIPYMVEGIVGKRATGGEMTAEQSGERFGMGLVFLVTLGLAGYKKFGGPGGTKVPVDVPIDPVRGPVDVPIDPVRGPVEPVDPVRVPTEPVDPVRVPEEPVRTPEEPVRTPEEPVRTPEEPVREPEEPVREPEEPVREPEEPVREPEEPVREPEEPVREPEEPVREPEEPVREPEEPVREPEEPVREPEEPVREPEEPVREPEEPVKEPQKTGLSPETEAAFRTFLGNKKFKLSAKDIEAIITQLNKRDGADGLAQRIMDGNYADLEGFGKVLSGLKQSPKIEPDLVAKTKQVLDAADALRNEGHEHVYFERATDPHGYDADVGGEPRASVSPEGPQPVVVQLKYVQTLKGVASNVTKGCTQLANAPRGVLKVVEVIVKDGTFEDFRAQGRETGIRDIQSNYPDTKIRIIFSDGVVWQIP